jgi:L-ascorbate metabolism protein UlaG (beta-lactamase superfamily)
MGEPIWFRWLGVAGIELRAGEHTLAIDPFVTRPTWRRLWHGRVEPDSALVAQKLPRCDAVLVTHPHWDHVLDVPEVARRSNADVYGSANTCHLLEVLGAARSRLHLLAAGDCLQMGPFGVEVLPAIHTRILGRPFLVGPLADELHPPLRLLDYRMDVDFSFRVSAGSYTLLDWSSESAEGATPADVLFVKPFGTRTYYAELLDAARPQLVIPIHWDNFLRPLSKPLRPMMRPPVWSLRPLRRVDLSAFRRMLGELAPDVDVFVPEMFRAYDLCERL